MKSQIVTKTFKGNMKKKKGRRKKRKVKWKINSRFTRYRKTDFSVPQTQVEGRQWRAHKCMC